MKKWFSEQEFHFISYGCRRKSYFECDLSPNECVEIENKDFWEEALSIEDIIWLRTADYVQTITYDFCDMRMSWSRNLSGCVHLFPSVRCNVECLECVGWLVVFVEPSEQVNLKRCCCESSGVINAECARLRVDVLDREESLEIKISAVRVMCFFRDGILQEVNSIIHVEWTSVEKSRIQVRAVVGDERDFRFDLKRHCIYHNLHELLRTRTVKQHDVSLLVYMTRAVQWFRIRRLLTTLQPHVELELITHASPTMNVLNLSFSIKKPIYFLSNKDCRVFRSFDWLDWLDW